MFIPEVTRTTKDSLFRFFAFVKPYWWRAVLVIAMSSLAGSMEAAVPYLIKPFTNEVLFDKAEVDLLFIPLLIVLATVAQSICKFASNYLGTWVGKRISNNLKMILFEKLMRNEAAFFDQSTSGDILFRYNTDADLASEGLIGNVNLFLHRLFMSAGLVAVLIYLSWILAMVAIAALVLAVIPLTLIRKKIKQLIQSSVVTGASISTHMNEAYGGNRTIASYNLYDVEREKLSYTLNALFRFSIKMVQRVGFVSIFMHSAMALGIAATIVLQGYLIKNNLITVGDFVAFIVTLLMLYTPIKGISNNYASVQAAFQSISRVLDAIDRQPAILDRPGAKPLSGVGKSICFNHVSFAYVAERPVLKNIDLEIKVGQSTAFVGNSGGGKTTLVNLLPRFYDVTSGSVRIDGEDIRDLRLDSLRDNIAVVFQDNFLFVGSIRDNIMMGRKDASEADLAQAVRAACLEDFVQSLPAGLDTLIGERGIMLSGGQKQRVAIARAFIKDAPVVILDEATSSLDNQSEVVVQQAIENLMKNKTVLIIAHRLSTVVNADRIVVVKDGAIAETGTHQELLNKEGGAYASLYRTQLW